MEGRCGRTDIRSAARGQVGRVAPADGKAVARGGKVMEQAIQVGEKTFANYQLETRAPLM